MRDGSPPPAVAGVVRVHSSALRDDPSRRCTDCDGTCTDDARGPWSDLVDRDAGSHERSMMPSTSPSPTTTATSDEGPGPSSGPSPRQILRDLAGVGHATADRDVAVMRAGPRLASA